MTQALTPRRIRILYRMVFRIMRQYAGRDFLPLLARLSLAGIFWRSLLTKVEVAKLFSYTELVTNEHVTDFPIERARLRLPEFPLELKSSTITLFENDFALPLLPANVSAWLATLGEFVLPILLVLGLFTRLSALGVLAMTLVIQIFVFPEAWWATHSVWAVLAIYLAVQGPGRISADHVLGKIFSR
jgi:putative oxidoreductase